MDEAQRKYILSTLSNEILKDPVKYGVRPDGTIRVGDTLDLSSLFKDTDKLKTIFSKAEKLTEDQKKSILENNQKIAAWVAAHPTEVLSTDKVNEILSSPIPPPAPKVEIKPEVKPEPPKAPEPELKLGSYTDIEQVAKVLANKTDEPKTELEEKFSSRSMASDVSFAQKVEAAFRNEIDVVYGKAGVLGMGKVEGVNSKDWIFMQKLPMAKVLEYFTGDSVKSGLPNDVVDQLSKSEKHQELVKQILGLLQETKGVIKPYDNESVSEFLRRLGAFVMKNNIK